MFRTVMASVLLATLAIVLVGCAISPDTAAEGSIARIDPSKEKDLKSPKDDVAVTITIRNTRQSTVHLHWIDYDGKRVHYGNIKAGAGFRKRTFEGHYWIILGEDKKPVGIYKTPRKDAVIVIE